MPSSSAGARGLMQVMPAAAQKLGQDGQACPTGPGDLLTDTQLQYSTGHDRVRRPYANAGTARWCWRSPAIMPGHGNVRRWLAANGDPRDGTVDPLDWIEQIPFGETRNYVQRVLENTEVYRNRLAGKDMPLRS